MVMVHGGTPCERLRVCGQRRERVSESERWRVVGGLGCLLWCCGGDTTADNCELKRLLELI